MGERFLHSPHQIRTSIVRGECSSQQFRSVFLDIPSLDRDAWVDAVLGLEEIPPDSPELPKGCVAYLPCEVDALLRLADSLPVRPHDVFVDIGSGLGRAAMLMHLLTGARAIGVEVQSALVKESRKIAENLRLSQVTFVHGDVLEQMASLSEGTVFFLYCPFGSARLMALLGKMEPWARARSMSICTVDLPLPPCSWFTRVGPSFRDLTMARSLPG